MSSYRKGASINRKIKVEESFINSKEDQVKSYNYKNLNYIDNKDYENNNILNSIFYGEEVMELLETEEEIEWSYKRNSPYNHHVILHHIPSGHE